LALWVPRGDSVKPRRFQFAAALIELPHHDHGVIDSDDILERHAFVSPGSNWTY